MKAENYYLTSPEVAKKVSTRLLETTLDGKTKVTFSDAGSKSAKQRGLQWMGYEDKARSGKGGRLGDTKENCHLEAKYRFAVPIFLRDDPFFADLYTRWCEICEVAEDKAGRMLYFIDQHVSTEKFTTSQMAEFLTEFRNDCMRKGIELREPEFRGLLDY